MATQRCGTPPRHGKHPVLKSVAARAFVLSALVCGSCAVVPAVTGAAGSVPGFVQHLGQGKTDSFWAARYDDVIKATRRAKDLIPSTYTSPRLSPLIREVKAETNRFDFELED